jgi:hypothetical protein
MFCSRGLTSSGKAPVAEVERQQQASTRRTWVKMLVVIEPDHPMVRKLTR